MDSVRPERGFHPALEGRRRDGAAGQRWAAVTFQIGAHTVRMRVPLKLVDERHVDLKHQRARSKTRDEIRDALYEQEERRIWRVLAWNLKARLVAVDEQVETFEEAFLAHLLDQRTGRTIYEQLAEDGRVELAAPLLALTTGEGILMGQNGVSHRCIDVHIRGVQSCT